MSERANIKHVFISHAADEDGEEAAALSDWLKTAYKNIDVFVSSLNSIECGCNPMESLLNGLRKTDALILLMTPAAVNNSWVVFEAGFAYGNKCRGKNPNNVLPIVCKGADVSNVPKPILSLMQAKDISRRDGLEQALSRLDSILKQSHTKSIEPLRELLSKRSKSMEPIVLQRRSYEDRTIM